MSEGSAEPVQRRGRPAAQAGPGAPAEDDLSRRLADLARDMQRQADSAAVLDVIVSAAVATVPGAEEASISLARRGRRVVSAAATGDVPRRFDDLQEETRQGPCMDSVYEHRTIRVDDLATDQRWPELARRAAETGVASMLCLRLFVAGDDLGSLTLLARRPGAFTDESERIGLLLASHAAVAVAQSQKVAHLNTALGSRDVIGQAKGVLMERYRITADQAFVLLARVSQDTNRKLHEVAEHLTDTGVLTVGGQPESVTAEPPPSRRGRQDGSSRTVDS